MKRPAAALLGCIAVLLLIAVAGVATIPTVPTGTWQPMGSMVVARSGAAAVLLQDQRVLITGGNNGTDAVNSAEVFNTDGSFASVIAMGIPRSGHMAVLLRDGRVLVAGGVTSGGGTTNSAEIYEPWWDTWTAIAGGMTEGRSKATAVLLQDGRVLIAGGQNGNAPSSTVEIFDPNTEQFSYAGSLSSPRMGLASASLADGRVLITGGSNGSVPVATSDVFDPTTNTVSAGPAMISPRVGHSATSLLDGGVLVAGGNNGSADLASAEMFDPAVGGFAAVASNLAAPRRDHGAIVLPNNNAVLIVGGTSAGNEVGTAETFVPSTGAFSATGSPAAARERALASALSPDGLLLMAGGSTAGVPASSAELYGFATVKTDAADYQPGSVVTITGSGWQPGETVTLTLVEAPLFDTHPSMTAVADGQGHITNSEFSPDEHDLNIRFYVTAVGNQSGYRAQNTFTDANPASLSVTPSPVTVAPGTAANYTVTVNFGGNGNPCTVTFSTSGLPTGATAIPNSGSVTNSSTSAPLQITTTASGVNATPAGSYTITVTGTRGSGCQGSGNVVGTATLNVQEPTTTTLTSGTNPTVFGQSTLLTATVTQTVGPTTPNAGAVTFKDGATTLGAGPVNIDGTGKATLTVSNLSVGSHSLTASYDGTTSFGTSNSNTVSQPVNQAATTTSVVSSVNPSAVGQSVTFTATVAASSPGSGIATGTVTFKDGAATLGTGTLNGSGAATLATSALTLGPHSITAVYGGDTNFTGSTSSTLTQTVNQASTTTTVASSANPSVFGQSVTFTATVVGSGGGTPTGTVTFKDGVTTLGTGALNGSGAAIFSTAALSVATHSITAVYGGDSNYTGSTSSALSQVVSQADTSTAVTSSPNPSVFGQTVNFAVTVAAVLPGTGTPTGTVQVKMGNTVLGSGTLSAGQAIVAVSSGLSVGTNGGIKAFYNGDTNFAASQTQNATQQTVNQASTTTSVVSSGSPSNYGQSVTFTATVAVVAPGAGTPTGTVNFYDGGTCAAPGPSLGSGTLSGTSPFQTSASTSTLDAVHSPHTVVACYAGDANFLGSNGSTSQTVNKLSVTPSITADDKDYDGTNAATIHCTLSGVLSGDTTNVTCTGTGTFADATAGPGKAVTSNNLALSGSASGNYVLSTTSASTTATIRKVDATINVTGYSVTYTGAAHTAAGTASGVGGADLSAFLNLTGTAHSDAGDYPADAWTFTGSTNYNDKSGTVHDHIDKANASITVTPYNVTYDGDPHSATGSATGVESPTPTDLSGLLHLGGTTHTAAGDYPTDSWTFDGNGNYNSTSGTVHDFIDKADPIVTATGGTFTYDGAPHGGSATALGVKGEALTPVNVAYTAGGSVLLTTAPVNAGNYSVAARFAGDANYKPKQSAAAPLVISRANAHISVTPYDVTYDGNPHTASGSATGVESPTPADLTSLLHLSGTTHTAAGDYPADSWAFDGNENYNATSGTVHDQIDKADPIVTATGGTFPYDGNPHAGSGSATGVQGEPLTPVNVAYTAGGAVLLTSAPVNAGNYQVAARFAGDTNYNPKQSAAVPLTITKVDAHVTATGYNVTYDTNPHTATGTATGVESPTPADLSSLLHLSGTTHTDAGDFTDNWTFDGNENYNATSGTVHDHIEKANANVGVTGYSVTYNAAAHTATATATGVGGVDLSAGLNLTGTSHTDAGDYPADAWSFSGAPNYKDQSGTVHDFIDKANATVSVTGYTVFYNGAPHVATGTATGVGGVDLSAGFNFSGTSHTDAGDYPSDSWSFSGAPNYKDQSGSVHDHIDKAPVTATAGSGAATYDGNTKTPTACAVSGVYTGDLTCTNNPASVGPNAGTTAIAAVVSGTGLTNFQISYVPGSFTIDKAATTTTVTFEAGPYVYRATAFTATAAVTGAGGLNAPVTPVTYSGDCVNVTAGGCTANASYAANGNYYGSSGSASIMITPATPTIIMTGLTTAYDGNPHPASGTAKGIGGVTVPGSFSFVYAPGGNAVPTLPGIYSALGTFTSGSQNYLSGGSGTAAVNIGYGVCSAGPGGVILPPINSDGSSVYQRKGGSTIPVKFRVCAANGSAIANPAAVFGSNNAGSITMLSAVRGTVTVVNEDTIADIPDVAFRFDGSQWIFNMATSNLQSASTYTFRINLANGNIVFMVGVK